MKRIRENFLPEDSSTTKPFISIKYLKKEKNFPYIKIKIVSFGGPEYKIIESNHFQMFLPCGVPIIPTPLPDTVKSFRIMKRNTSLKWGYVKLS